MYRASPLKPGAIAGSFTAETGVCVGDEGYYKSFASAFHLCIMKRFERHVFRADATLTWLKTIDPSQRWQNCKELKDYPSDLGLLS